MPVLLKPISSKELAEALGLEHFGEAPINSKYFNFRGTQTK